MITHQMEEVERLCERILLLKDGRAEAYGTVDEVQNQYGGRIVRLKYSGRIPLSGHYSVTLEENNYAELTLTGAEDESLILRELLDAGVSVRGFAVTKVSLDDIFIKIYGNQNVAYQREMAGA